MTQTSNSIHSSDLLPGIYCHMSCLALNLRIFSDQSHGNKGQSRGYGFVALKSPRKGDFWSTLGILFSDEMLASNINTIHVLPGKLPGSKSSVLNHHEPKVLSKPATQPMPSKAAGSGTTVCNAPIHMNISSR